MPYGYLVTIVIIGVVTLIALLAPRLPARVGIAAYFLSVLVNEVPLLVLLLFIASTLPAVLVDGLLDTVAGAVVFLIALALAAGLLWLQRPVPRARPVLESAIGAPISTPPPWRSRLLPFTVRPRRVDRLGPIRYGPDRRHRLDVYRRRDVGGPAPVLVYWHGGGYFSGGRRRESRLLRYRFAQRGWVVVSADYRLRPQAGWPDHLIDAKRVLAWIGRHADEHAIDPSRIVASGSSAGAHLSVMCALTPNAPGLQPGFEDADTSIVAAVGLYGYYGRYYGRGPDESPVSDPLALSAAHAPPVLLVHGDHDTYTPVTSARALGAHLRSGSPSTVAYAELPGAQHGFDVLASERFEAVVAATELFLDREVA